ncbi:hypothetical protein PanWU01x14_214180 [Parasponia andersonii]|uniref:Secreted protein n=1 Tax=Parasponia andersonii TaxID=3476 RepID=A0A2P5BSF4_PARAD|nr:hypothetical protein PanWU01x14_214180 [Parasponia andersonii]
MRPTPSRLQDRMLLWLSLATIATIAVESLNSASTQTRVGLTCSFESLDIRSSVDRPRMGRWNSRTCIVDRSE